MLGKKIVVKKCEKTFFIITRISLPKMGGKTLETIFPGTQQIVLAKNVGKKSSQKNFEKTFFIFTRIS